MAKQEKDNQINAFVPQLTLEKYVAGGMTTPERQEFESLLAKSDELQQRVASVNASNRIFQNGLPDDEFCQKLLVLEKASGQTAKTKGLSSQPSQTLAPLSQAMAWLSPRRVAIFGAPFIVLLVAGLILFNPNPGNELEENLLNGNELGSGSEETHTGPAGSQVPPNSNGDASSKSNGSKWIGLKGDGLKLLVYKEFENKLIALKPGEKLSPGQSVRIGYANIKPEQPVYGAIYSIDGGGQVTLHFPESLEKSTRLENSKQMLLSFAYKLDNAPDFERFYFLTSSSKIPLGILLMKASHLSKNKTAVKAGKGVKMPGQSNTVTLIVHKP